MTTDPWIHMLEQIEPAYHKYMKILNEGIKFKVELIRISNNKCQIHIRELEGLIEFGELDEKCVWAADQLNSWPDCHRVSWDRWQFNHRKDAEKFRTLFTLKWAQ